MYIRTTLALAAGLSLGAAPAQVTELARATLADTGQSGGSGISTGDLFYSGWRFEITDGPVQTVSVGGHFSFFGDTVFGAIVRLTGPNDDPDSFDLTGGDVVATTILSGTGNASAEVTGDLVTTLENGWYVVLFGAGRFGASASGGGLQAQDPSSAIPGAQPIVTYRQPTHPLGQGGPFLQGTVCRVFVRFQAGGCAADFNGDGTLDFFDYLDFVQAFSENADAADFNNDGVIDFFDYLDFVQAFSQGC